MKKGKRDKAPEPIALYRASHRGARISARKARLVMDLIRGEPVERALVQLQFSDRRAAPMVRKVVQSAVANATQKDAVDSEKLVVHRAYVDEGPTMKRWRPRSMGRAFPRLKRTCHLSVILGHVVAAPKARAAETSEPDAGAAESQNQAGGAGPEGQSGGEK